MEIEKDHFIPAPPPSNNGSLPLSTDSLNTADFKGADSLLTDSAFFFFLRQQESKWQMINMCSLRMSQFMQIDRSTALEIRKALSWKGKCRLKMVKDSFQQVLSCQPTYSSQCARMDFKTVQQKLLCSKSGIIAFTQAKSNCLFENCQIRLSFNLS